MDGKRQRTVCRRDYKNALMCNNFRHVRPREKHQKRFGEALQLTERIQPYLKAQSSFQVHDWNVFLQLELPIRRFNAK